MQVPGNQKKIINEYFYVKSWKLPLFSVSHFSFPCAASTHSFILKEKIRCNIKLQQYVIAKLEFLFCGLMFRWAENV